MKKIYSFAFAVAAIFAASCQTENLEPTVQGEGFSITATTEVDSKTVLNAEEKAIYWAPGDKISVFDAANKEVAFTTDLKENSKTATFWCYSGFSAPTNFIAAYPYRGAYLFDGTVVSNFRIAGTQKAVAGSFDPEFAGAIGLPKEAGSTKLSFKNIHSLVKFTVGGETAPKSVVLK